MRFPLDFLGVNHYSRMILRHSALVPYLGVVPVTPRGAGVELAANGWEVYPAGMYEVLRDYGAYSEIPELLVTENGAAFEDCVREDGTVEDVERTSYLRRYLAEVLRARRDGVNVGGYFVWSLLDNFEWDRGYADRFGVVHVDRDSQRRTLKASGRWYRDFLSG